MKLSIALTTYNHERFIEDALNSILSQNINCKYEIVIGNDCSTDKTSYIIDDYKVKYPNLIKDLPRIKNLGYIKNFDDTMQSCIGEYISIFDGDDIMLANKINLQIEYLDLNLDCVIVGHKTRAFNSSTGKTIEEMHPSVKKDKYTIEDLILQGSILANSSKMFRKSAYPKQGIDTNVKLIADWYITLEIAKKGKIGFIDQTLVDYRVHKDSIMQKIKGKIHSEDINYILNKIEKDYPGKYSHLFYRQKAYAFFALGMQYHEENMKINARKYYWKAIKIDPFYGYNIYLKLGITFLPSEFYNYLKKNIK